MCMIPMYLSATVFAGLASRNVFVRTCTKRGTHLGGLVRDAFSRDLPRRVLADPGLGERVLDPVDLQPAVVHPQTDVLQPRVRLVEVVYLFFGIVSRPNDVSTFYVRSVLLV